MLQAYPLEKIEYIWGKVNRRGDAHIYVFDQVIQDIMTKDECRADGDDTAASFQSAKEAGLVVLGTVHSHPDCDTTVPSEHDFTEGADHGEVVSGICAVFKTKGRLRTRLGWWFPAANLQMVLTERKR